LQALGYTDDAISELTRKQAREILGADPGVIAAALAVIPHNSDDPHSENFWKEIGQSPGRHYMVRIGMAIKAEIGEAGFPLFLKWRSNGDPNCDPDKVRKKWDGFHPTQIGVGTIFWMAEIACPGWRGSPPEKIFAEARRNGWQPRLKTVPPTHPSAEDDANKGRDKMRQIGRGFMED